MLHFHIVPDSAEAFEIPDTWEIFARSNKYIGVIFLLLTDRHNIFYLETEKYQHSVLENAISFPSNTLFYSVCSE